MAQGKNLVIIENIFQLVEKLGIEYNILIETSWAAISM